MRDSSFMYRFFIFAVLTCLSSQTLAQVQCTDVFSNSVATFNQSGGNAIFQQNTRINNSDGAIDFSAGSIAFTNNSSGICGSSGNQQCSSSGNFAEALDLPDFLFSNSNTDIDIGNNSNGATIIEGQFDSVRVRNNQTLNFISVNGVYIIDELRLDQNATANFAPGDYWINELDLRQNSNITTNGDGLVRLFVSDVGERGGDIGTILQNVDINLNQSSRNFIIVSFDDFRHPQNVNINAHLYAVDDVLIGNNSRFTGSIVVGDELIVQQNAQITFDNEEPRSLLFGDLCAGSELIASYDFEEPAPTIDTTNDNDGSFIGGSIDVRLEGATNSQTCSVLDVPLNTSIGNNDGFETPINVAGQLGGEGTISFWYRSDVQWNRGFFGLDRKLFDASLPFGNQDDDEDKFFFLVLQNNGSLLFGLEDDDDNNGLLLSAPLNFAADEWVHIAVTWDVDSRQMALFINGAPLGTVFIENALSGPLSQTNTLRFGDNRSSYLPAVGTTPNSGDGQFDALRLYNFAQSTQEVNADRLATDVSNCGAPLDAIAFYQFQPNQVPDDSLDFSDGNLVGNATGIVLPGRPNVCGVLDVPLNQVPTPNDAFDTQVNIGNTMGNRGTISFWYRSDEDWNLGGQGLDRKLFDASIPFGNGDDDEDKFFFLNLQNNGRLRFGLEDPNDNNSILETGVLNFSANEWVHVAATWDVITQEMTLFINGSATGASFLERNAFGQVSVTNTLFVGDNRSTYLPGVGTTANSSNGQFDEVRLYRFDQTSTQVMTDINAQPPGCFDDLLVDHYRLSYGSSFTCAASEVTVEACANDNCDVRSTANASLSLTVEGNGSFSTTDLTFVGVTTSALSATSTGIVTIGADSLVPNADVRCFNNNVEDNSCQLDFAEVGLTVSFGDAQNIIEIPDTISQLPFNDEIIVSLDQPEVCDAELEGRSLDIAVQCNDPNSCNANQLNIGSTNIGNIEEFNPTGATFDADGQAVIPPNTLQYLDAGNIEFLFRDSLGVATGNSEDFVMRPILVAGIGTDEDFVAGEPNLLFYEAVGAIGSLTPNYNPSNLQMQIIKVLPESELSEQGEMTFFGDEEPGIPTRDPGEAMFDDIDENGFGFMGNEPGRSVDIQPVYSEVGTVTLQLRDEDYLGSGAINSAAFTPFGLQVGPITLGQYIPAFFSVEVNDVNLSNTCDVFSYVGQNIEFATDLTFTVRAHNARGGVTLNYGGNNLVTGTGTPSDDDLWELEITDDDLDFEDTTDNDGMVFSSLSANGTDANFDGMAIYTVSRPTGDGFGDLELLFPVARHTKGAPAIAPFTASFSALLSNDEVNGIPTIVDADGVCLRENADSECEELEPVVIDGASMRYGRLVFDNAFGPETEDIQIPFRTEYFADINDDPNEEEFAFIVNEEDNCTELTLTDADFGRTTPEADIPPLDSVIVNISSLGRLLNGQSLPITTDGIMVPTVNQIGGFTLSIQPQDPSVGIGDEDEAMRSLGEHFLNFDWDNDGDIDDDDFPSALVSFGLFRGNDRIIFWREVFNQ